MRIVSVMQGRPIVVKPYCGQTINFLKRKEPETVNFGIGKHASKKNKATLLRATKWII